MRQSTTLVLAERFSQPGYPC